MRLHTVTFILRQRDRRERTKIESATTRYKVIRYLFFLQSIELAVTIAQPPAHSLLQVTNRSFLYASSYLWN